MCAATRARRAWPMSITPTPPAAIASRSLLTSRGVGVDLVTMAAAETFDFSNDVAIIIGNDTGNLNIWGTPAAVGHVSGAGKPIIGVGEGGYAFFGQLSLAIGHANGWHIPSGSPSSPNVTVVNGSQAIYAAPYPIATSTGDLLALYSAPVDIVEISVPGAAPCRCQPDRPRLVCPARPAAFTALFADLAAWPEERVLRAVGLHRRAVVGCIGHQHDQHRPGSVREYGAGQALRRDAIGIG